MKSTKMEILRMANKHGLRDVDKEIITCSLKLADVLARKGELENAEMGFRHCVRQQIKVSFFFL